MNIVVNRLDQDSTFAQIAVVVLVVKMKTTKTTLIGKNFNMTNAKMNMMTIIKLFDVKLSRNLSSYARK